MTGRALFNLVLLPFVIHRGIEEFQVGHWWLFSITVTTAFWCAVDFAIERFKKRP